MTFLSWIGYKRDRDWKRLGKLFYGGDRCKVLLYGFREGMCGAKPNLVGDPPFLQGDIHLPVDVYGEKTFHLHVGFITTSETGTQEDIYTVMLECMPMVAFPVGGLWLDVSLESSPGYCPFK